jgi:hypothetical protein
MRDFKQHARIPVPESWTLVGVADEHGILGPDEIYVCIQGPEDDADKRKWLEGETLIFRSPVIHPGDMQVVHAIGKPPKGTPLEKNPLPNCVIFSCQGRRPLSTCLAGGDLDGDVYCVSPLKELHPKRFYPPAAYTELKSENADNQPNNISARPLATIDDIAEFAVKYIINDNLGLIAMNQRIIADQCEEGVFHPDCIKLADLYSQAVDYVKTGKPVRNDEIPKLHYDARPDWNASELKDPTREYYESKSALGKLYRAVVLPEIELPEPPPGDVINRSLSLANATDDISVTIREIIRPYCPNPKLGVVPASISQYFFEYRAQFASICVAHTLTLSEHGRLFEEEVVVGTILQRTSQEKKRKTMIYKMGGQSIHLNTRIRHALSGEDKDALYPPLEHLRRACHAWTFSLQKGDNSGAKSFGLVVVSSILDAVERLEKNEQESGNGS